jgi:hypothetical protein
MIGPPLSLSVAPGVVSVPGTPEFNGSFPSGFFPGLHPVKAQMIHSKIKATRIDLRKRAVLADILILLSPSFSTFFN